MHEPTIAQPAAERPLATDPEAGPPDASLADDPRALQILTTEHWSLLSARSLAYNEAFTRASMLLSFLAMSFVALALLAQAMAFGGEILLISAIVLGFDFVVALVTYVRVAGANMDDLRAMHGMARIRHGYTQISPTVAPYFVTPTHDDIASVLSTYRSDSGGSVLRDLLYGLSTSLGLVGLILSLLGGAVAGVVVLAAGGSALAAVVAAVVGAIVVFVAGTQWVYAEIMRNQRSIPAVFPSPESGGLGSKG